MVPSAVRLTAAFENQSVYDPDGARLVYRTTAGLSPKFVTTTTAFPFLLLLKA